MYMQMTVISSRDLECIHLAAFMIPILVCVYPGLFALECMIEWRSQDKTSSVKLRSPLAAKEYSILVCHCVGSLYRVALDHLTELEESSLNRGVHFWLEIVDSQLFQEKAHGYSGSAEKFGGHEGGLVQRLEEKPNSGVKKPKMLRPAGGSGVLAVQGSQSNG
ncbi:hypothetical protein K449DRAFT_464447 [Hypoxylon sp. EC38]|nr:hypothetical protein K449DRAFT_464447 [Hypoxylon sp. EC38]